MYFKYAVFQRLKNIFTYFHVILASVNSRCVFLYPNIKGMEDILLSQKQYRALLSRLDEINDDVTSIKLNSMTPEVRYIDNHDLLKILQITNRTIIRWRNSGLLPFKKIGSRFYYRADLVLDIFKMTPVEPTEVQKPPLEASPLKIGDVQITCEKCPLFLLLDWDNQCVKTDKP